MNSFADARPAVTPATAVDLLDCFDDTPTSSTFGMIAAQANMPRRLQVGGRIV
jgi:hypothetical protein